jgi:hypothetical protein
LRAWAREAFLNSDWLHVGINIVRGNPAPTYNFAFLPDGSTVVTPLPAALPLFATSLGATALLGWRRKRKTRPAA